MTGDESTPGALKDDAKLRGAILIVLAVLFLALSAIAIVYEGYSAVL